MNILADIALTMVPNCGATRIKKLITEFGSAENIFNTPKSLLVEQGRLSHDVANFIAAKASFADAEREMKFLTHFSIKAIPATSERYPHRLVNCYDYPHVIYVKGDTDLNSKHFVAVVGTRNMTTYGQRMCEVVVGELAELMPDVVIVSGLAYGVDITAHKAAMKGGAKTVAVMGRNLSSIYPAPHTSWANCMVAEGGALVSEYNSMQNPDKSGFVQRNRIIATMCDAVLVVESASKGGSLHTVDFANAENRDVFAIPGRVGDKYSQGTNQIITDGRARLVSSATDIVSAMMWRRGDAPRQASLFEGVVDGMSPLAQKVYGNMDIDPTDGDALALKCGVSQSELSGVLFELELEGLIRSISGNRFIRL